MKLGISTYSFYQLTSKGIMKQFDTISKSKELGFDVIEFAGLDTPDGESAESFANKIKEKCDEEGIEVGNYTISADFINCPDGDWEREAERIKGHVRLAKILGAPGMRHDPTFGFKADKKGAKSFDDALPILAKGCRAVTEYAESLGIKTMVENHGFFSQDSERVEKLVSSVNHENFGVLIDIGNFLCVDENPTAAVGRLTPYAFHVHVKDFHFKSGNEPDPGEGWFSSRGGNYLRGSIIGHGCVPVMQCLKILKKSEYDGTIAIEFEGMEDCIKGIEIGLKNLRSYIALI